MNLIISNVIKYHLHAISEKCIKQAHNTKHHLEQMTLFPCLLSGELELNMNGY